MNKKGENGKNDNILADFQNYKKKVIRNRILYYILFFTEIFLFILFFSPAFHLISFKLEYFLILLFLIFINVFFLFMLGMSLAPYSYFNIIEDILDMGMGKIKLDKKSPFKSKLNHKLNDASYVDFSTNDPDLPKLFFIKVSPSFPHICVFIPFNSTDCVFWSKQYINFKKEYETKIKELLKNDFQANIIESSTERQYSWPPTYNVLTAMFHKNNASGQDIIESVKLLNKIDLIINKKPSRLIPLKNEDFELINYSRTNFYRCEKCDNFLGFKHRDKDNNNIFKYLPNKCKFCKTKANYEKEIYY